MQVFVIENRFDFGDLELVRLGIKRLFDCATVSVSTDLRSAGGPFTGRPQNVIHISFFDAIKFRECAEITQLHVTPS